MADIDLSWAASRAFKIDGFYSLEAIRSSQASYFISGASLTNPAQVWRASNRDLVHSAGLTARWAAIPDRLEFKLEGLVSLDSTRIKVLTLPFSPATSDRPLPAITGNMASLRLDGDYKIGEALDLHLGYEFQHYRSTDFSYLNAAPDAIAQILGSGELLPRYDVHVGMMSVRYHF
jgi:hypothetical protein